MNTDPAQTFLPPEVAELPRQITTAPVTSDWLIVVGAGILVGIGAVLWVKYGPKRRRRRHHHHHEHSSEELAATKAAEPAGHSSASQRRRRRRWSKRNPTLAQTGGLPPLREEGPAETPQNN